MKVSSEQPFNSLLHWKNEDKSFGDVKYTIFLANSGHFLAFFMSLGKMFWLKTWYIHVFSRKSRKFVIFLGKMQEINAFEANIDSFQQIFVKYLLFPHPDISLMTKYLAQIKFYTYFNIGDAKTMVKLKRKIRVNSPGVVPYTHLFQACLGDFFVLLALKFGQITKLLTENITTACSLLE